MSILFPYMHWLPTNKSWKEQFYSFLEKDEVSWKDLVALSKYRLNFVQTNMMYSLLSKLLAEKKISGLPEKSINLALLGSSTLAHLHSGIAVAALRRGILVKIYENNYGQYRQDILDDNSEFYNFLPDVTLFSFDPYHFLPQDMYAFGENDLKAWKENFEADISGLWETVKRKSKCAIIQQTLLPSISCIFGNNEHKFPTSKNRMVSMMNESLRTLSITQKVDILSVDTQVQIDGLEAWHDVALWYRSKQDVLPTASPMYGELVSRILAAQRGLSYKCLVLDLDNTIWGGVIGDDGLAGIKLGQGNALGEAFTAIQSYAKELSKRGIILAVCSKNEKHIALDAFDRHSDMILRKEDISCFVANWENKADNIRYIARTLNIGIDSLVFLDDNPMERNLVRQELPEVAVPELLDDPSYYPRAIIDAGYFESVGLTQEDLKRSEQYQANAEREILKKSFTNMNDFLSGLDMVLKYDLINGNSIDRCTQLINKTNQFNLMTRRYTLEEIDALSKDTDNICLCFRLIDKFGDNGIISIVTGKIEGKSLIIENWIMSCRVLGRGVEKAVLNLLVSEGHKRGITTIYGEYTPTAKNEMVKDHYTKLGFTQLEDSTDLLQKNRLSVESYNEFSVPIETKRE